MPSQYRRPSDQLLRRGGEWAGVPWLDSGRLSIRAIGGWDTIKSYAALTARNVRRLLEPARSGWKRIAMRLLAQEHHSARRFAATDP